MFIDHIAVALLLTSYTEEGIAVFRSSEGLNTMYQWMRHIGRFAFPIFCYFVVEGYFHTRSRIRYCIQLAVFAAISQSPFVYALFTEKSRLSGYHLNVLFTLLLGLFCIWAVDELVYRPLFPVYSRSGEGAGEHNGRGAVSLNTALGIACAVLITCVCCWVADYFHTDYRYGGVVTILIFYLLRKYPVPACVTAYFALSLYSSSEVWALPGFIALLFYNGKRGVQNKYFFYAFYPAHLAFLWLLKGI